MTTDDRARYFGLKLNDQSLTPGDKPRVGQLRFNEWLRIPILQK